jgi:K+/H+ antiporter YhaU regulatory subunit KhtT
MADDEAAPAANRHRGEIAVTLRQQGSDAPTEFVMRPDFEAVAAIDDQLGSIIALTRRAIAEPASLSLAELAVVVAEGIKAHGRSVGDSNAHVRTEKIKRMIFDSGVPTVVPAVLQFLTAAVTGGAKESAPGKA